MKRTLRMILVLLTILACFLPASAFATEQVKPHGALNDLIGFSLFGGNIGFDTGWQGPNVLGYYLQFRFAAKVNGELLKISNAQGNALLSYTPASPSVGQLRFQGSSGTASCDFGAQFSSTWKAGGSLIGNHSGNLPILPNWDFRIADSKQFTQYLIGSSVTLDDSFDPITIISYGPNIGFSSAKIAAKLGGSLNMRISGRGVTSSEGTYAASGLTCPVIGPSKNISHISMHYNVEPTLVVSPSGNIEFSIFWVVEVDQPIVTFNIPVALPAFTRATSTASVSFSLPDISTPSSVEFGNVYAGTSASQSLSVANAGEATLNVSSVSFDNTDDYSVSATTFSVPGGGAVPLTITFRPKSAGARPGTLFIASNDHDSPMKLVSLGANGILHIISGLAGPNGSIDPGSIGVEPGSRVTFTATPDTGYMVDRWSLDSEAAQINGTTFALSNIQADHAVAVTFKRPVISAEAGPDGSIDPSGAITLNAGDNLALTATPDTGCIVDRWSVDGLVVQTGGTAFTVTNIQADHAIAVTFKHPVVTAEAGPNGSIDPSGSITLDAGDSLTVTATPDDGYIVVGWLLDGQLVQTGGTTYTGTEYALNNILADHAVKVAFTRPVVTATSATGGTFSPGGSISPSGSITACAGESMVFTAGPTSTSIVDRWFVDEQVQQTGGASLTLDNIQTNHTVHVTFRFPLVAATAGPNGSITPSGSVSTGYSSVNFTATPDPGYVVDQWIVDGQPTTGGGNVSLQSNGTVLMVMNSQTDRAVHVTFAPITITAITSVGGSIDPGGEMTGSFGDSITFTASPAPGYSVGQWNVNGYVKQTGGTTYTLTLNESRSNHPFSYYAHYSVKVIFSVAITATAGPGVSISPDGSTDVSVGDMVTFTAAREPGSEGEGQMYWFIDGQKQDFVGTGCTLSNVQVPHTLRAEFGALLTADAGPNGTISPSGDIVIPPGESFIFTATPHAGYVVRSWTHNGWESGNSNNTWTVTPQPYITHTLTVAFGLPSIWGAEGAALIFIPEPELPEGGWYWYVDSIVTPAGTITANLDDVVTFTAVPPPGYAIDHWIVHSFPDGVYVREEAATNEATFNLLVQGNHGVFVVIKELKIVATSGDNGWVYAPDPPATSIVTGEPLAEHGSSMTFAAFPFQNYIVDQWFVDDQVVQTGGLTFTLEDIQDAHTVHAAFKQPVVACMAGPNGSIDPSETVSIPTGGNAIFTATPDSGHVIDQWYVDGQAAQTGGTTLTLQNIQSDRAVAVTFGRIPGDVNGDCKVNVLDLIFIRNRLNADVNTGDNWKADVNGDGKINVLDLIFVRNRLNTACP